ncbi:MAG TPA: hypothetical protein VG456_06890 [Candidatus Sulfopaludibacter sp.]|jgi:hypothetical protein|nr:hypothetical protein [Candidatus Sulfopaludibacter sp.]
MTFDPNAYGPEVAAILALDTQPAAALALLKTTSARQLFPHARAPEAALAGLYLRCGAWNEAHEIAQDIATPEGSYWHALVHRAEPDESNAAYWFRQTGRHPIFAELANAAHKPTWDPFSVSDPEIQRLEWQLLFDYCASGTNS